MDPNSSNQDDTQSTSHLVVPAPPQQTALGPAVPLPGQSQSPAQPVQPVQPITPPPPLAPAPSGPIPPKVFSQDSHVPPPPPDGKNQSFDNLPKTKTVSKKMAAILVGLFVVIALPLTVFVSQQKQNTNIGAANTLGPNTIVAIFNGKNIYEKDLEKIASEQYDPNSIDRDALKDALDTAIERNILDLEKSQKNITVSDAEISAKDGEGFDQPAAYYEALKDKVILIETKSWQAFSIDFWIPPTDEQADMSATEKKAAAKQLSDGLKALTEAQTQIAGNTPPLDIARSLTTKYPSIANVLGVNGYLLVDLTDGANLLDVTNPLVYSYQKTNVGQVFFDTLYSMKTPGEIKKATSKGSSGGSVIKLIKSNSNPTFNTYEDFLASKKAALAKIVYSL